MTTYDKEALYDIEFLGGTSVQFELKKGEVNMLVTMPNPRTIANVTTLIICVILGYLGTEEVISRGSFDMEDQSFLYLVQRGNVNTGYGRSQGLSTLFLVQCGSERKMRFGIRYGPDPDPDAAISDLDLTGSVGDVEMLKTFLSPFRFCH